MLLSVAIAFTKLLHELGHALTARHFGARCQEMGLMLLVFTPCLYCDVTDGWKLPSRLHRVAISAAGILVEVVLASVCGLLWCVTEPGPFHSMLFNIMVVCSVGTVLINANPLLRYDGYYILSDVLDRPNLWQTSRRELNQFIQRVVGLAKIDRSGSKPTTDRLQLAYAIASSVYRVIVLLTVGWFVLQVCSQYGITVIGYGMVLMVAGGVLGPPSYRVVDSMRDPTLRKRLHRPRFLLSLCVAAGGLLFASFVPLPSRVNAAARIRPLDARKVYVSVPGTLVESIRPGERVHEGQQLARLENLQVERELHEVRSKAALQQARLLHLQSLRNESEALAAQIPAAEQQLIELRSEVEQLEKDREALILRAPLDGRVLEPSALPRSEREYPELAFWEGTPLDRCNLGAFLTRQTLLCSVNPSDRVEAELYVDQFDVGRVQEGQYVRLCVESHGGRFLEGEVIRISRTVADRIPNELVAGKRIAPEANRAKPETPMYRVLVRLDSTEAPLIPGATAQAKVSVTSQTLAAQLFRLLKRTFRLSSL
ncbi:MAG: HlyD family efflux transporter periplasmic adaptor subunit [Planctomycetota bacterium]